ncbi:MAG TPA: cation:proton antiporter [Nitrospiria bacterium]|nr:cation:proton antiporter [Nitrospiria bacterium]
MPQIEFLQELVIIFGLSVGIVLIFQRLHLPSIVGFLISGALIGPYGLNLIADVERVEVLAEVGVVLLLFTIGLEFSLARLSHIRTFALTGGSLQVGLTIALTALILWIFDLPPRMGIFWGFLLALSSTAIVLKILLDREELDTPHGRLALGILIFQDLIVVPMILIAPLLSGDVSKDPMQVLMTLGKSVLLIGAILVAARWMVPKVLIQVVRTRSRELFVITVILIGLTIAWLGAESGLSLALGAFIAGLVISESEYSHQALADIMPFRDSFNSLFFVSIGMLLDMRFFLDQPLLILGAAVAVLVLKGAIAGGVTLALGYPIRVAALVGLSLAQVGEFSFILAQTGQVLGLFTQNSYQLFLVISILSMMAAPFLIRWGPRISRRTELFKSAGRWVRSRKSPDLEPYHLRLHDHVIIAGYGLNGRNLARVLKDAEISYVIVDIQGDIIRHARAQGEPIYFGDVTHTEVLRHLRIKEAKVLVLAVSDPFAVRASIQVARQANPNIHIVVRTRYLKEVDELLDLGANQVVPEEFETSLEIFDLVLQQFQISASQIFRKKQEVRREGYARLRRDETEPFATHGRMPEELQVERYTLRPRSFLTGKTLAELGLPARSAALVVAIIRGDETRSSPGGGFQIEEGDTLVLVGTRDDLDRAIGYLEAFTDAPESL